MAEHIVKILESQYINPTVKRFVVQKPAGYTFTPGQATDVSINLPEWKEQKRKFAFTSLNRWEHLEFIIRIYRERDGVTEMLGKINAGDELIIGEPYGAIEYKGPGVFIAGGTGITPFIAILRELYKNGQIGNNKLIVSERTSKDLILDNELQNMLGNNYIKTFTREGVIGFIDRHINEDFLLKNISDFGQRFYVCGPESFVKNISNMLIELGAKPDSLVIDK
ncbi:MAG: FAD-binding oxidoreductase [Chitinophagales bacterium]|nr:FAD-binding oxidoreductase [Chitinophagales bacterium]MDW8418908.1 FAD-binding oxidoreductase [Chitinophagales bacterium]